MDDALVERGILYAPDFVANAGGILNIAEELTGYSRDRALASTARIEATIDPGARARPASGGSRRGGRRSGSPASASRPRRAPAGGGSPATPPRGPNGAPLTRLRP